MRGGDELSLHTGQSTSVTPTTDEMDNAAAKLPPVGTSFKKPAAAKLKSTKSECDRDRRLCFRRLAGGAKQGRTGADRGFGLGWLVLLENLWDQ